MKLLKNVTFALCLLTAFGTQYASDEYFDKLPKLVVETPAVVTACTLTCDGRTFQASKEFVESCKTLKDCLAVSMDDGSPIDIPGIKHEALSLLIALHQDIEYKKTIYGLEPRAFINLVQAADYLDLKSKVYDAILDKAYTEISAIEDTTVKAFYVTYLPQAVALNVFAKYPCAYNGVPLALDLRFHRITASDWSHNESKIAITDTSIVHILDTKLNAIIKPLKGHKYEITSVKFSNDDSKILTSSFDRTAKVWDTEAGRNILTLEGHRDIVISASWSPDGTKIATASKDRTVKIWNAETGEETMTFERHFVDGKYEDHLNSLTSICWSPDGTKIATGSEDHAVIIWDPETGREIESIHGFAGAIKSVNWSPDGSKLLVTPAGFDNVTIWDAKTYAKTIALEDIKEPVISAAWSSDGYKIITLTRNHEIKTWHAETGKKITTMSFQPQIATALLSPDGSKIFTAFNCQDYRSKDLIMWETTDPMQEYKEHEAVCTAHERRADAVEKIKRVMSTLPDDVERETKRERKE